MYLTPTFSLTIHIIECKYWNISSNGTIQIKTEGNRDEKRRRTTGTPMSRYLAIFVKDGHIMNISRYPDLNPIIKELVKPVLLLVKLKTLNYLGSSKFTKVTPH